MDLTASGGAWHLLRILAQTAFLLTVLLLLVRLVQAHRATRVRPSGRASRPPSRGGRAALLLLALAGGAILAYQATWQLGGILRPEFVAFMQLHDRRQFNPAHRLERGRILDRAGLVLAYSAELDGRVERRYPEGAASVHVVGYSHPRFGSSGIEAVANRRLNGGEPHDWLDWGNLGRQVVTQERRPRGRDVQLTLDAVMQRQAVALFGARAGAAVVLEVADGAIRVLVSQPAFDPNHLTAALFAGRDPAAPLLNRATHGRYPPGSIFKVLPAAVALEQGFRGTLDCPAEGFTTSPRYPPIRDHEYYSARRAGRTWAGHGRLGLDEALAKSSNVFFARLGVDLGLDALAATGARWHFNRTLILHESPYGTWSLRTGTLPQLRPNDRYGLAQLAIGQGRMLVTPAHMAMIAAAIANDGLAMQPYLLDGSAPRPLGRMLDPEHARRLRAMLRAAMVSGTGRALEDPRLALAGKTGTAQHAHGASHSWFIGFAPADRPRLAVAVLVEQGGYGSAAAAPLARDLLLFAQTQGWLP